MHGAQNDVLEPFTGFEVQLVLEVSLMILDEAQINRLHGPRSEKVHRIYHPIATIYSSARMITCPPPQYCDMGSLRAQLDAGALRSSKGDSRLPNRVAVLELAADISRGMLHLHSLNILHSDVKVSVVQSQAT
jgi:hypothetical protein